MKALGVDIGKKRDPAALVQVERRGSFCHVTHVGRLPIGTPYDQVGTAIGKIGAGADIVVADTGGVGEAALDLVARDHPDLLLWRVVLTSGKTVKVNREERRASVPKVRLIGHIAAALRAGRLLVDAGEVGLALLKEMHQFVARQSTRGHITMCAESGSHDDLVIALALALLGLKLGGL